MLDRAKYFGPADARIEVRKTIKREAMTAFWRVLRRLCAPATNYSGNWSILLGCTEGSRACCFFCVFSIVLLSRNTPCDFRQLARNVPSREVDVEGPVSIVILFSTHCATYLCLNHSSRSYNRDTPGSAPQVCVPSRIGGEESHELP